MKNWTSSELRKAYLDFFASNGHAVIKSSSLIPENDASVLFTTAGMQPLVPYLLGEKHPSGTRLCNVQKCVRTGDIDEVGDATHCTFFEMLGNWSLGDYFKRESIEFSYKFLTEVLNINKKDIAVSVFAGDEDAERDIESANRWEEMGLSKEQIFYLPKKNNWWGVGDNGPCGPDTEIFYVTNKEVSEIDNTPASDDGKYIEIWNNVFMQFFKGVGEQYTLLKQKNVDTGMGLERTLCVLNGLNSVYETDLFKDVVEEISNLANIKYGEEKTSTRAIRIVADHVRTATFIIGDEKGVVPSNVDQGYVVRRLIRRAVRFARILALDPIKLLEISDMYIKKYEQIYPELTSNKQFIKETLATEISKFEKTIEKGLKEIDKVLQYVQGDKLNGKTAFRLYDTFGFPLEMTCEIAKEKGYKVDIEGFNAAFEKHKNMSKQGAEVKFRGGLASDTEKTARLHTATHLLLAGLKKILGKEVEQRGSNITEERLRFDFNFDRAMTNEEIDEVENFVNSVIKEGIDIECSEMSIEKARECGATGIFDNKYGETVKVFTIGKYSKEICGGPHANNTKELGVFKIKKEQSSSAGVRRIKAVLV